MLIFIRQAFDCQTYDVDCWQMLCQNNCRKSETQMGNLGTLLCNRQRKPPNIEELGKRRAKFCCARYGYSLFFLWMLAAGMQSAKADDVRFPRFSPDGKSLIFDRCNPSYPERCRIHIYSLGSGALGYYKPPSGQTWLQAHYADTGDKLVFVSMPVGDRARSILSQRENILLNTQIAVMNHDGSNMQIVTDTIGYKGMPAFSHSGKKVIFAQAERLRDSGETIAEFWDLQELDLDTWAVTLFAGRSFGFYQMGMSTYFKGDNSVLLNADTPMDQDGSLQLPTGDYGGHSNNSQIYVLVRGKATLDTPLFEKYASANDAHMDSEGNIFFLGTGDSDGTTIRSDRRDNQHLSWPAPPFGESGGSFVGSSISQDGRYFAISVIYGDYSDRNMKLMLLDIASGAWREIDLPQQAIQINK